MTATFRLRAGELNEGFLEKLNAMFHDREIEVVVYDPNEVTESDYPHGKPVQEEYLIDAIDRVDRGEGLVYTDVEALRNHG